MSFSANLSASYSLIIVLPCRWAPHHTPPNTPHSTLQQQQHDTQCTRTPAHSDADRRAHPQPRKPLSFVHGHSIAMAPKPKSTPPRGGGHGPTCAAVPHDEKKAKRQRISSKASAAAADPGNSTPAAACPAPPPPAAACPAPPPPAAACPALAADCPPLAKDSPAPPEALPELDGPPVVLAPAAACPAPAAACSALEEHLALAVAACPTPGAAACPAPAAACPAPAAACPAPAAACPAAGPVRGNTKRRAGPAARAPDPGRKGNKPLPTSALPTDSMMNAAYNLCIAEALEVIMQHDVFAGISTMAPLSIEGSAGGSQADLHSHLLHTHSQQPARPPT